MEWELTECPGQRVLAHLGGTAVVAIARPVGASGRGAPESYLSGSPFLSDVATHLEGLAVEARDPLRRDTIRNVIRSIRERLEYRQHHPKEYPIQSYPKPLPMTPAEFDNGILPELAGLPQKLHRVGAELMAVLNNPKQPHADRVRAATLLGRLKYVLAIPVLMDHVSLFDPTAKDSPLNLKTGHRPPEYPCRTALVAFRTCASLEFAHRIAKATSTDEVRRWKRDVLDEDALRGIITHLRGMVVEETDATRQALLRSFVRLLNADDDEVPPTDFRSALLLMCIAIPIALAIGYAVGRRASR